MPEIFVADKNKITKPGRVKKSRDVWLSELSENKKPGVFSSFALEPKTVKFETQDPHEKIILLLRQHPIVNLGWLLVLALMLVAPSFLVMVPDWSFIPIRFQTMTLLLWYLLALAFGIEKFLSWFFNAYIVTDERLVDIDFNGLLYRDLSVVKIANVEEINFTQIGSFSAIFDYGDVHIQTAAEKRELTFDRVPHPGKVTEILFQLIEEEEQEQLEGRTR